MACEVSVATDLSQACFPCFHIIIAEALQLAKIHQYVQLRHRLTGAGLVESSPNNLYCVSAWRWVLRILVVPLLD